MKDLQEFLQDAELLHYHDSLRTRLKLNSVAQLRCVDDDELTSLGMTKPEVRRLRQFVKKECPESALTKLKKVSGLLQMVYLFFVYSHTQHAVQPSAVVLCR